MNNTSLHLCTWCGGNLFHYSCVIVGGAGGAGGACCGGSVDGGEGNP